jgi:hypothetical protein
MPETKGRVESVLEFRGTFIELVVVATAIGLGINLLAGALGPAIGTGYSIFVGVLLVSASCIVIAARFVPKVNRTLSIEGVILITKDGRIIRIDRYAFSKDLADFFRALFLENKAIERTWRSSKHSFLSRGQDPKASNEDLIEAAANKKLVREAVEYFILDKLSLNLTDYFNRNSEIDDVAIVTLERNDIPSVLLSNRFLDLLSRPMEERESFSTFKRNRPPPNLGEGFKAQVVAAYTGEGAIFDQFDLVLPRGSAVSRSGDHSLLIDTKRFSIRFETLFDGYGGSLPSHFEELYIGLKGDEAATYEVRIEVDVALKWMTLFSRTG